jgi:hypothetical protein
MLVLNQVRRWGAAGVTAGAVTLALAALAGCASTGGSGSGLSAGLGGNPPDQAATAPSSVPPPPPPPPPPVDLAGRWKLSVANGGACVVTLGDTAGASEGSVAPAGGCPGKFFTSRKWTFEHDRLILRDHKGEVLVELSFADGRSQGQGLGGGAITLMR